MQNLKIRVNNERERIEIQELLFKLGYAWQNYGTQINNNDYVKYIYAKTSKLIFHGVMAMDFINDPSKQVTIYDLKLMVEEKDITERGGEVNINIEEEFVLPEKWCVVANKITNNYARNTFNSRIKKDNLSPNLYLCIDTTRGNNYDCYNFLNNKEGYTEITFERFQKYVLNNQEEVKPKYLKVWAWDDDVTEAFETYLIAEFEGLDHGGNYLVVRRGDVRYFQSGVGFSVSFEKNISYTNPNINPTVKAIANRIKKEFEKHGQLDWAMVAAHKIYSSHVKESK